MCSIMRKIASSRREIIVTERRLEKIRKVVQHAELHLQTVSEEAARIEARLCTKQEELAEKNRMLLAAFCT